MTQNRAAVGSVAFQKMGKISAEYTDCLDNTEFWVKIKMI
jgi:hypothetical protein